MFMRIFLPAKKSAKMVNGSLAFIFYILYSAFYIPRGLILPAHDDLETNPGKANQLGVVALYIDLCAAWSIVVVVCNEGKMLLVFYTHRSNAHVCRF